MEPEKKTPEEEKKPAPAAEQKDEPKPEEKPAENKQTDDNGMAEKTPVINKPHKNAVWKKYGRGDKIWTCDLCVPNAALYQTEPHLELSSL